MSDDATNRIYYFLMIYLASKLIEKQAVGKDELFYNHAQLSAILEAEQIKPGEKLHRVIEQTGDILEAIGGICERDAHAGARLLKELRLKNEDAGVLHGKLWALATKMGFLLNAKDISAEEVCVLLDIPLSPEGRKYQYVAGDNERTKWRPLHGTTSAAVDNRTSSRDGASISQSPYRTTCVRDKSSSPTQKSPCALLPSRSANRN